MDGETLVAGCEDHALKVVDVEKSYIVKQSVLTQHKVPTCIDTAHGNLILSGSEDAVIRLWDLRQERIARKLPVFDGHSRWISSVKFNAQVENVFISSSLDGTVKLWDLRNDESPLANLKHKSQDEYMVFAAEWNGAS